MMKVKITKDTFYGGHLATGTAIDVDEATADRWIKNGIAAKESGKKDKTAKNSKE